MIEIKEYTPELDHCWNDFVASSKNGTFLLDRQYMNYHAARFSDASLLFINQKGKLCGVFPANVQDCTIYSHGGLTYGGLIIDSVCHYSEVCEMLLCACNYYAKKKIKKIVYKTIPYIYHTLPSDEDLYWLYVNGAQLTCRSISSVIDMGNPLPFSELRQRKIRKASDAGLEIRFEDFSLVENFWNILEENLLLRHSTKPVHSLAEIRLLQQRFPKEITLSVVIFENSIVAGCVVYKTTKVAHVQYISANEKGKEVGALDLLFHVLTQKYAEEGFKYFDFGISTENGGKMLNDGLLFQKEGFGGRAICYDTYEYKIP